MINYEVYSEKHLQNFISLLEQCKQNDVTDLSIVLKDIKSLFEERKKEIEQRFEVLKREAIIECPSCNKNRLVHTPNEDGLKIFTCPSCRYSEIRE